MNHNPATALPWNTEVDIGSTDIVGPHEQHIFMGRRNDEAPSATDAEYAVRAANAYPKLVDGVRYAMNRLKADGNQPQVAADLESLLRELGEAT